MSITVEEKFDSRETTDGESIELLYVVSGTTDDAEALTAMKTAAPDVYRDMVRRNCRIEPIRVDDDNPEKGVWLGVAPYTPASRVTPDPPEVGESSYSFDTGGGTQHVTQSIQTVNKYAPPGKAAPDFKGAIGVTHDSVEGVDITVPVYNFSETHILADTAVTETYKGTLFSLTGKVNSDTFRGLAAGQCLFLGASGSKRGDGNWEVTFSFAASPNKTDLTVGEITGIDKKGWEYMWVRYADAEDTTAKTLVKKPAAVYIEKVYEDGDFSGLGIGT